MAAEFLVDYFKTNFDNTCFTVPVTGCQSIAMLDSLSENGLLLLMADKGHVLERDLNGRTLPTPIPHGGCYSFSVNFLAFAKWFEFGGGDVEQAGSMLRDILKRDSTRSDAHQQLGCLLLDDNGV